MARKPPQNKQTLGSIADEIWLVREQIREAEAKVNDLKRQRDDLEANLLSQMRAEDTDICRGSKATVSVSTQDRVRLADFDKAAPWIKRHNALHLFERRISATAYKELVEAKGLKSIPGLEVYVQDRLNVRSL